MIRDGKQVEGSSDATKSVQRKENEIEQVDQTSDTDPVKGKEVTTKRGTRPPLNYQAILNDAKVTINTSSLENLCDQLYAGVFLEPGKSASSIFLFLFFLIDDRNRRIYHANFI